MAVQIMCGVAAILLFSACMGRVAVSMGAFSFREGFINALAMAACLVGVVALVLMAITRS